LICGHTFHEYIYLCWHVPVCFMNIFIYVDMCLCFLWIYSSRLKGDCVFHEYIHLGWKVVEHFYIQVSQEECARLREGVPYGKVYRCNPKHLCPKLNGYGDNGQKKAWSSSGSVHCSCQLTRLISVCPWVWYGVMSLLASDVSCIVLGNPEDNYDRSASYFVA
jgi:hypothetical protein